jgi:hypothetical protein
MNTLLLTSTFPFVPDTTIPVLYQTTDGFAVPDLPVQQKMRCSFLLSTSICQTKEHIINNMKSIQAYRAINYTYRYV